jgi:hypothetical protein
MNAPCPHHCPPGSGRGTTGPLAALVLVLVAVAVLAGPLAHAATEALSAVIDVVEIAALTVGSATALAALATVAVLGYRARTRHRNGAPPAQALIARPVRTHIAAPVRVPLTGRVSRPLPVSVRTWQLGRADGYRQPARLRPARQAAVITTWRTDDPCPVCGTGLHSTGAGRAVVRQDCPLCGWSATWHTPDGR